MTFDEHLRIVIGDLVVNVARLAAENDTLRAAAPPAPPPEPPPSDDHKLPPDWKLP